MPCLLWLNFNILNLFLSPWIQIQKTSESGSRTGYETLVIVPFKLAIRGWNIGAGVKIRKKVKPKPEPKINNFNSATLI